MAPSASPLPYAPSLASWPGNVVTSELPAALLSCPLVLVCAADGEKPTAADRDNMQPSIMGRLSGADDASDAPDATAAEEGASAVSQPEEDLTAAMLQSNGILLPRSPGTAPPAASAATPAAGMFSHPYPSCFTQLTCVIVWMPICPTLVTNAHWHAHHSGLSRPSSSMFLLSSPFVSWLQCSCR